MRETPALMAPLKCCHFKAMAVILKIVFALGIKLCLCILTFSSCLCCSLSWLSILEIISLRYALSSSMAFCCWARRSCIAETDIWRTTLTQLHSLDRHVLSLHLDLFVQSECVRVRYFEAARLCAVLLAPGREWCACVWSPPETRALRAERKGAPSAQSLLWETWTKKQKNRITSKRVFLYIVCKCLDSTVDFTKQLSKFPSRISCVNVHLKR